MPEENIDAKSSSPLLTVLVAVVVLAGLVMLLMPSVGGGPAGPRAASINNLHNISLALMQYEAMHGELPAAAVRDGDGKLLYSWRVSILPYIEATAHFERFAKDEPWNSAHNLTLLSPMPSLYQCPSVDSAQPDETSVVAIVGDETMWPDAGGMSVTSAKDGPAKTILVVMLADSGIKWTEPRDLTIAEVLAAVKRTRGPGPHLIKGSFLLVATVDGAVHVIDNPTPQDIEAMLTRAGGEAVVLP